MRWVIMVIAALIFSGCASGPMEVRLGPWTAPHITGKTGMPMPYDPLSRLNACPTGPTRSYPTFIGGECI